MLKRYLSVLLLIVLSLACGLPAQAEAPSAFTFRNGIRFGMNRSEVKSCEGAKPDKEKLAALLYENQEFAGLKGELQYRFDRGQLCEITFTFTESHEDANQYITDFKAVDEELQNQYGAPTLNGEKVWLTDTRTKDASQWGAAIASGALRMETAYFHFFSPADILHSLFGEEGAITHALIFLPD